MCSKTKELLSTIHKISQKHGIWYTTVRGTALAAIRHKGGCFDDIDGDIQIRTEKDGILLEKVLKESGYHVISKRNKIKKFQDAEKGDTFYSKQSKTLIFRLFPCPENSFPYIDVHLSIHGFVVNEREPCTLGEIKTFCPKNTVRYLKEVYKSDWETPKPNQYVPYLKTGKHITGCTK